VTLFWTGDEREAREVRRVGEWRDGIYVPEDRPAAQPSVPWPSPRRTSQLSDIVRALRELRPR
jgi:hypothetical protein